jgi:LacI family transcriptional regulator
MTEGLSRRLAREFCGKISSGQWPLGGRVPTTRELAATYGVSVNTIQSAFRELEATNLVERRARLGGFVKNLPSPERPTVRAATTIAVAGHHVTEDDEAADAWAYSIMRGCNRELGDAGMHTALFSFDPADPRAVEATLARIDETGDALAGVLYFVHPASHRLPDALDARNIPWVSINPAREHAAHNFVAQDAARAGRLIGRCLARMDLPRVVMLSERIVVGRSSSALYFGFMQGWLECGGRSRDIDYVSAGGLGEIDGYAAIRDHVAAHGRPGAVFATGDILTMGAIRALRDAGSDVGRDVYVIGGTGLDFTAFAHPPLTVNEVPTAQMGKVAAQMLLEMARDGVRRLLGRYIPARLVVRESCPIPESLVAEQSKLIAEESAT